MMGLSFFKQPEGSMTVLQKAELQKMMSDLERRRKIRDDMYSSPSFTAEAMNNVRIDHCAIAETDLRWLLEKLINDPQEGDGI